MTAHRRTWWRVPSTAFATARSSPLMEPPVTACGRFLDGLCLSGCRSRRIVSNDGLRALPVVLAVCHW